MNFSFFTVATLVLLHFKFRILSDFTEFMIPYPIWFPFNIVMDFANLRVPAACAVTGAAARSATINVNTRNNAMTRFLIFFIFYQILSEGNFFHHRIILHVFFFFESLNQWHEINFFHFSFAFRDILIIVNFIHIQLLKMNKELRLIKLLRSIFASKQRHQRIP